MTWIGSRLYAYKYQKTDIDIANRNKRTGYTMNGFDKMNKKLLASQVEDALMDDILNKPVPIGEKIPNEYELAEMYGVGRSTIRETVKSLVSKGILEVRQGSGTYVIGTDTLENDPLGFSKYEDKYKLALELFEVRLMLEPEIAALAAQKATEQDKEEIVRLCDEVENFYRAGKIIQKDQHFMRRLQRQVVTVW